MFTFDPPVEYVNNIGLLDIDAVSVVETSFLLGGEPKSATQMVPIYGENSFQSLPLNGPAIGGPVEKITLIMTRPVGVSSISFCYSPAKTLAPPMSVPPTTDGGTDTSPSSEPLSASEPTPTQQISSTSETCVPAVVDFNLLPDGKKLDKGEYLTRQYKLFYGLELSAAGGLGSAPRLFDTAQVSNITYGNLDLGSPNRNCFVGGPGIGSGSSPGPNGDNLFQNCPCIPLGNVLIIQEDNGYEAQPDDNLFGGVMSFDFLPPVDEIEIELLDIDYLASITVVYIDDEGKMQEKPPFDVPRRGSNSLQKIALNETNVVQLRLNLQSSGAVPSLSFCYLPPGPSSYSRRSFDITYT